MRPFCYTLRLVTLVAMLPMLNGCWPKEDPMTLPSVQGPSAGRVELQIGQVNMGEDYHDRIYYNLRTGATHSVRNDVYDLALGHADAGYPVLLNEGKLAQGIRTDSYDFAQANSTAGLRWQPDAPSQHPDSLIFSGWQALRNANGHSPVYLIHRGSLYHSTAQRFYKVQILSAQPHQVVLQCAPASHTGNVAPCTLALSPVHSHTYLNLETASAVTVAPPDGDWHLLFTRHFHIFTSEPLDSPTRNYSVTGVLAHRAGGVQAVRLSDAHSIQTLPLEVATAAMPLAAADAIGYDWKLFDLNTGFSMVPNRVYGVWLPSGERYLLQFIDFFNESGQKGVPTFWYQTYSTEDHSIPTP
jgi:hypothetical protein